MKKLVLGMIGVIMMAAPGFADDRISDRNYDRNYDRSPSDQNIYNERADYRNYNPTREYNVRDGRQELSPSAGMGRMMGPMAYRDRFPNMNPMGIDNRPGEFFTYQYVSDKRAMDISMK